MKKIFISVLLFFLFADNIQGQILPDQDFGKVEKLIGQSRIIGLGEEEHFYRESNENRIDIIKRLIVDNKINSIVFEYPGVNVYIINEYIHNKIDKSKLLTALKQFKQLDGGPFFDSKEMFSFVEWLKDRNRGDNLIEVYGMDFYNYTSAITFLQKQSKQTQNFQKVKQALDTLTHYLRRNPSHLVSKELTKLSIENLTMIKRLLSNIDTSLSESLKCSVYDLYTYSLWFTDLNNRDSLMFQKFTEIDNIEKKYLIWAANFHIQNDSLKTPNYISNLFGSLMTKKYKGQYFKIGVISTNPCGQDNDHRVIVPPASCNYQSKLDLIVLIPKGDKTMSIFDK